MSLSSPIPATQLARIKLLQDDMYTQIWSLFPPNQPAIASVKFPLSPTSDPLRSYTLLMRAVASQLRKRCAPVRDALVDVLLLRLEDPLPPSGAELAKTAVAATKDIFVLANLMRSDLAHAVLGSMRECDLVEYVRSQAATRERSFVSEQWTRVELTDMWTGWTANLSLGNEQELRSRWRRRLTQALGSAAPVSCFLPGARALIDGGASNILPPQLFFSTPELLRLQNLVQALAITACLRTLAGLAGGSDAGAAFADRILVLLRSEIAALHAGETKLVHLADEVVRARGAGEAEEEQLRGAVARTLRAEDPVFRLLLQRVLSTLGAAIETSRVAVAPGTIRTGRLPQPSRLRSAEDGIDGSLPSAMGLVAGFEDPCLRIGLEEALTQVHDVVLWTEQVWPDQAQNA